MKQPLLLTLALLTLALLLGTGCASMTPGQGGYESAFAIGSKGATAPARKLIERAELHIEADNTVKQATAARKLVQAEGGFVENAHIDEDYARITFRVPATKIAGTMDVLSSLGRETYRDFSARDVTGTHTDLNAQLLNKEQALKRLRELLPTITDAKRVLHVEAEMTKLQKEIDSIRASLARTNMQVVYAGLDFEIERSRIPGPITLAARGVGTVLKKLFFLN